METEQLNLYQKIVEVRKVAGGFFKDSKSFGYTYVSGNQVLSKIKDKMDELNLLLIPSSRLAELEDCWTKHEYKNSKGQPKLDFVVWGSMSYTWIDGDKPEDRLEVPWVFFGQQDDISKAYGSALTYSERYFLLKCLGLPTDDEDPDARQKPAKVKQTVSKTTTPKPPAPPVKKTPTYRTSPEELGAFLQTIGEIECTEKDALAVASELAKRELTNLRILGKQELTKVYNYLKKGKEVS